MLSVHSCQLAARPVHRRCKYEWPSHIQVVPDGLVIASFNHLPPSDLRPEGVTLLEVGDGMGVYINNFYIIDLRYVRLIGNKISNRT